MHPNSQGNSKSGFTAIWHAYLRGAKERNYEFTLTKEEFRKLTKENCWYCGKKPSGIKQYKGCRDYYLYNGIDRVDNDKGYVIENCMPCCKTCNYMKSTLPADMFINHVRKIVENLGL